MMLRSWPRPRRLAIALALALAFQLAFIGLALQAAAASRGLRVAIRDTDEKGVIVSETLDLYGQSHALVIGIDRYSAGWPQLSNAVQDAEAVASELRGRGFSVQLERNLEADELDRVLEDFFIDRGADPEARLLVWFAGHGHTLKDQGYLVPADTPRPGADIRGFRKKAVPLRRFGELVREAESKHVLAVFDSCFSGTIFGGSRAGPPPAISRATAYPVRQFLSSGDAEQEVSDDGRFRALFLGALRGERGADANRDGYLTASELSLFLETAVTNYTSSAQTPRYGKLRDPDYDRGDFVFLVPGSQPPEEVVRLPEVSAFDLADLERSAVSEEDVRQAWTLRRQGMKQDFQRTRVFERRDLSQELKRTAWERFLAAYPEDDPYSREDEQLQTEAQQRMNALKPPHAKLVLKKGGIHDMVYVQEGEYLSGCNIRIDEDCDDDELPGDLRYVDAYYIDRTEVTVAAYAKCVHAGRCSEPETRVRCTWGETGKQEHPITCVTWAQSSSYCAWAGKRLPTEWEWEKAARGSADGRKYPWGNRGYDSMRRLANIADREAKKEWNWSWVVASYDDGFSATAPVGSYPEGMSPAGALDMMGNVSEWTSTPRDGSRVLRGGSWGSLPHSARVSERTWTDPTDGLESYGFRCAQ
jgi:formylglycine-generating enzyme required for sulfatase activity